MRYLDHHEDLDSPPELVQEFQAIRVPVLLNIALTALKAQPPSNSSAIRAATKALEINGLKDAEKAKAYYRRGLAYAATKEEEEAEKDLVNADKLLGGQDLALKAELEKVRAKRKEKREKDKKAFRGLFS